MAEPVTVGVFIATVLGIAGEAILKGAVGEAVKDSYSVLKGKIAHWARDDVEALEKAPTSAARQAVVAEIIDAQPADCLPSLRASAERLSSDLKAAGSIGLDITRLTAQEVELGDIAVTGEGNSGVHADDWRVHGTFRTGAINVGAKSGKS